MTQEIGESREKLGWDVVQMVQDFASKVEADGRPFYVVYAAKEDKAMSNKLGKGVFIQAMKAYYAKPPALLGILVWYVDQAKGEFRFMPELSAPPDVPVDETLLSNKASDFSERVASQGEKLNVLIS